MGWIGKAATTVAVICCLSGLLTRQAEGQSAGAGQWQSSVVFYDDDGRLVYVSDEEGNRVPDFSYAGYHYGEKPLPEVAVVVRLGPAPGDNTARIQAALDAIGERPRDAHGHRGALLLGPGVYEIGGTLRIRHSGVVLRGSGNGTDPSESTILFARGNEPNKRTVVTIGTERGSPWTAGSPVDITDDFVPVSALGFSVADASAFTVGQEVMIHHPSTQAWIDAVDGGGVVRNRRWEAGTKDIQWIRRITGIHGSTLQLDAPIYNHLDRSLTQATVAPITRRELISEAGIEHLRIDIETAGGDDEAHAWNAIALIGAEDSWVRTISARYFGQAAVRTQGAIRITVKDVRGTEPVARHTSPNKYNFMVHHLSQLILFTGCHASGGRHHFVSNGVQTSSGIVFHRCTMEAGGVEGHRHWTQAMLFDNLRDISERNSQAKLINRGDMGSSHGWAAVHSVIWNFNREITVQKPPTAQNYAVSSEGYLREQPWMPGDWGHIEVRTDAGRLVPESLYEAQLNERLSLRAADRRLRRQPQ